jgi:hypothetical protein
MGLDYKFPNLDGPLFVIKQVAELDGRIVAVGAVRIEAELYLWIDHSVGEPEDRWDAVKELNDVGMDKAYWEQGLDNCVCWVPEAVEKSFGKRLKQLGFDTDRDGWRSWSRPTRIVE